MTMVGGLLEYLAVCERQMGPCAGAGSSSWWTLVFCSPFAFCNVLCLFVRHLGLP